VPAAIHTFGHTVDHTVSYTAGNVGPATGLELEWESESELGSGSEWDSVFHLESATGSLSV